MTLTATKTSTEERRQPSKAAKQRVRDAFDPTVLANLCTTWNFSRYAKRVDLDESPAGRERFYYYADNDSDILAVAHLDSVQDDGTCSIVDTSAGLLAVSGALDDRLGVYVILDLLPKLGITCDWLLTTDEEICASTAGDFFTDKHYNWMFQFDRGGTDVVMYDYETDELCGLVEDCGAQVGNGSFSDICMLEHLECAGFNWGVGYRDYHGPRSHAWLEDTFRMVARFVKFYNANAGKALAYEPRSWNRNQGAGYREDSESYEAWWAQQDDGVVADCGHAVDLGDDSTFIECEGGHYVICVKCGTP